MVGIDEAEVDKIYCVVIKSTDAADVIEWWFEQEECPSPFDGCGVGHEIGTWVYNDNYDEWVKYEDKIAEMQEFLEEINQ